MKRTTVICPVCGTVNRDLFLEETDGWFECQECMCSSQVVPEAGLNGTKDGNGNESGSMFFASVVKRRALV